jgi:hypothetical protein
MANLPAASGEQTADWLAVVKTRRNAIRGQSIPATSGSTALDEFRHHAPGDIDQLIAEVEQLRQSELAERILIRDQGRALRTAESELDHLRTHLAGIEWAAADAAGAPAQAVCPACRVLKPGPHSPGCFIAAELGR